MAAGALVHRFRAARRDPELAVVEGFHAIKHALRFGADVLEVAGSDPDVPERLAAVLAPDLRGRFQQLIEMVEPDVLAQIAPHAPGTGVMAIARRPRYDLTTALREPGPAILLEDPRTLGNLGACVRVAAAAGAAALLCTGKSDPWHPDALRGAAGLHFALPVVRVDDVPDSTRPLVALDPEGDDLDPRRLPDDALLAFGAERYGLSDALLARADLRLRVPMRDGVSSLNLATTVAAVLYAWRLG